MLAIAHVAVPAAMAPPLDDVAPHWTTCTDCAAPPVTFLSPPANDIERRNRLRSLGYITK